MRCSHFGSGTATIMQQLYIFITFLFAVAAMDVQKQRKEEVQKLRRIARDADVERCPDNAKKEAVSACHDL